MKWFKHDSTAHIDAKLTKLRMKYGIVGYGLYWYCLELIALEIDPKKVTFELEHDAEIIAQTWSMEVQEVQEIMEFMVNLHLFERSENGFISCLKLAHRLDDTNSRNPEVKRVLEGLKEQEDLNLAPTSDRIDKNRLDKIRIDKNKKKVEQRFDQFWEVYPKKRKKLDAKKSWVKKVKTEETADFIIEHVKQRIECDPEWLKDNGQYIPLPTTFLNQGLWTDIYEVPRAVGYQMKPFVE